MHLLRASEPTPKVFDDAYAEAETIIMEIDMDDLDPMAAQKTTMQLGLLPAGQTLPEQLPPEVAAKLAAYQKRLGLAPGMLNQMRPWLAAMTLTQVHLMKLGLDPQAGMEQRVMSKAATDRKTILGFETIEEQLSMLANLSPKLQTEFLAQTLAEADQVEQEIDKMMAAWRSGDTKGLEKLLNTMEDNPEIYRTLITDRNRNWSTKLDTLLKENDDYLVVVGAMHLVGKDSVVELLKKRGYKISQH